MQKPTSQSEATVTVTGLVSGSRDLVPFETVFLLFRKFSEVNRSKDGLTTLGAGEKAQLLGALE